MFTISGEEFSCLPNISFLLFTVCALCFLKKEETTKDREINVIEKKNKSQGKFDLDKHYETYSFLLQDILKAPRIERVDSDSSMESMPTFEEMMNPRRRSYSADDIDSLNLIPDSRLTEPFERALMRKNLTPYSELSIFTETSWDKLSINDDIY